MSEAAAAALALGAALAAGLLIGVERGWARRGEPPGGRVAGVRTHALLGLGGGLAGWAGRGGLSLAAGAIVLGLVGAVLLGHWRKGVHDGAIDSTGAVAASLTVALGLVAGMGQPGLAVAGAAVSLLILALRRELHGLMRKMDAEDVRAVAQFAVIALAVMPFLPDRAMGPLMAWNPYQLWAVVVLVTGFSLAGHVANRLFGARHGTIATALIGGAYSSTAVTQALSQTIRAGGRAGVENAGIALASAVMYLRVLLLVGLIAPRLLGPLALLVGAPLIVTWGAALLLLRRARGVAADGVADGAGVATPGNPVALVPALGFLLFVALALVAAKWAEGRFGGAGLAVLLLVTGSMDVDAAIVTAGRLGPDAIDAALAALALAGTILANMAVKLGLVVATAGRGGRPGAVALAASMAVLTVGIGIGAAVRLGG